MTWTKADWALLRLALTIGGVITLIGWLLTLLGCASFPATKVIIGTLIRVERREDLEPHCGLTERHTNPECVRQMRAYEGVVADSAGHHESFYFFSNEGNVIPQEGWVARWTLHRGEIFPLGRCPFFGCQYAGFVDYRLEDDTDVSPVKP